ncbi:UDP-glucose:glyco protein glucosyltransferase precursor [Delitschia confertaspora ATCC 74209]|uniref:UDP-glucose:glyco protein glucosyltransferase n=1 Tax=Delitschia confertaspora ATCC 74209 TaxID=1513339 RepID=A0A9P4JT29_9PLEO|nr:UDP-glucose:glyco protein glucosyltransferase precursor [Delitschia confertaspora ATCC 74209]
MRAFRSSLSLRCLFILSAIRPFTISASPSVNVALKTSFTSAPYLVELLETAAEEVPDAYFPILDRIAEGYFHEAITDKQLYETFVELLLEDGYVEDLETLSSFRFALSVHSAAPRIEAHYQFYNTSVEPSLKVDQGTSCETWASFGGKQYCSPRLEESHGSIKREISYELPFDRILGDPSNSLPSIVYADITSSSFAEFHKTISKTAVDGKTSYRVRYKPSLNGSKSPLVVNGYGVELALKRTDYIVIDDRPAEETGEKPSTQKPLGTKLHDDEEVTDLKPLSASEVSTLGISAASFVMKSDQPFDTLLKLSQDFPKHSSAIINHNATEEFIKEHRENREQLLPPGYNIIWINGVQVPTRDVNPFSLLEHLRRERKLINGVRSLGLSAPDAISLLSHSAITETQTEDEPQRYDFRDEIEGGNVIIWLNDIEKDKKYEDWPTELSALLQPTFPGQMPQIRRDLHNAIVPVDFSDSDDVQSIVGTVQNLIRRRIPVRWGLVPRTNTPGAEAQAIVVWHLLETYGISAVMRYLESSSAARKLSFPDNATFESIIKNARVHKDRTKLPLSDVLTQEALRGQISKFNQYLARLAADGTSPPIFVNGVPIAQNDEWLQALSRRISQDLRSIQKGVFENIFQEDAWLPQFFLFQAAQRRNPLIIPENEKNVTLFNMAKIFSTHGHILDQIPHVSGEESAKKEDWAHLTVIGDFDSDSGFTLSNAAASFRKEQKNVEIMFIHNPAMASSGLNRAKGILKGWDEVDPSKIDDLHALWRSAKPLITELGLQPGQSGLLLNGRLIGPIPSSQEFTKADLELLVSYEGRKRIQPAVKAMEALGLLEKISSPLDSAMITSLVALSTVSDVPEGIFESASTLRMDAFNQWGANYTAITTGNPKDSVIQIVASIDPASELAQKWIPLLKVLSEMEGVYLRLFLNPTERMQELPVKRFYRFVLGSEPTFNEDGSVKDLQAHFTGIPKDALLNLGMDVPPSWLVSPSESIYDLDNIKLSSFHTGGDVDAVYELENILIEGHSRDVNNAGAPPRGAELVLSTEKIPHFADTIIMANLGYFQFKANPGFYKIQLKEGRSKEIFNIDSAGTKGWLPQPGDETSEIVLMSFQGTTLFPRMSRKPGQEEADVLGTDESLASEIVEKGTKMANKILSKVGLSKNIDTQKIISKGAGLWTAVTSRAGLTTNTKTEEAQAEINIFSVASGHLYERMLNIMMLSVMKHTKHTVKFWFIEQFLSPSFKSFLPTMAAEYGFDYEMVTYKWPHWLRGQREKQREIWGYKILFLDVLFPLDLDKVIFVDADQIVRTDMYELVTHDLKGAPYGFTPMCDSRTEMEGFRFWKQGYWKNFLRGLPYHISALYVIDLKRFRQLAAGDRLRQQYQALSADPNSLSNLDQDLPNNMQFNLPIHSLPQEWLWCETWCSDESLKDAKTIDLCNNPQTKEPKLDRARRQVPEWTVYDEEIAALARRVRAKEGVSAQEGGEAKDKDKVEIKKGEDEVSRKDEL